MNKFNHCIDPRCSTTRLVTAIAPPFLSEANKQLESKFYLNEIEGHKGKGGLRIKGHFKRSYEKRDDQWCVSNRQDGSYEPISLAVEFEGKHLPLITVITVVFNGEQFLEETIQSIINQSYPNIEYIIIDGGSTDGTLDIVRKYEHAVDYWVSEKDTGIYNAMNKGIALASGQWINFMNCGDQFASINILSELLQICSLDAHFLMGDVRILNNGKSRIVSACSSSKYSMPTCHQAIFYRTDILKKFWFDTHYKVGADFNQYVRIITASSETRISFFHGIIANVTAGGYSAQNETILQMDYFQTIRTYRGLLPSYQFIVGRKVKGWVRTMLTKAGVMKTI